MKKLNIKDSNRICVSNLVIKEIKKINDNELKKISCDKNKAMELIFLFSSFLSHQFFSYAQSRERKFKCLNSEILQERLGNKYCRIIELLLSHELIERDESYKAGEGGFSKSYRLSLPVLLGNVKEYILTHQDLVIGQQKWVAKKLEKASNNTIAAYLTDKVYPEISYPTKSYLIDYGKELVKNGFETNKGKKLKYRGKKSRPKSLNRDNIRFLEDDIILYENLVKGGVIIPTIGNSKSGGRVYDAHNLCPSWIRNKMMINGEAVSELDYSCLHPNLACYLHGNTKITISHLDVSKKLGISLKKAKRLHLSFFNLKYEDFVNSQLVKYYLKTQPIMYKSLLESKRSSQKELTYQLFGLETKIMTDVVKDFESNNILALYVFDAMYVQESKIPEALKIMNTVVDRMGINTCAKYKKGR